MAAAATTAFASSKISPECCRMIHHLLPKSSPQYLNGTPKPKTAAYSLGSRRRRQISCVKNNDVPDRFVSRFSANEPRKGADVLVEALEREGVAVVFACPDPGDEILQALTRSKTVRNVLPRQERGGVFAAEGYARATGRPGVCIATSGPRALDLVTGIANAHEDSVPLVTIIGQVPRRMSWTDAPIVEITRPITKHNYLVLDVKDIPKIVKEAFSLARSGRPGPVLIDVPKDIQQQMVIPDWDQPMRLPASPDQSVLEKIVGLIVESRRPVLYVGGGCVDASKELRDFVKLTGIPVASTLMGLGCYPSSSSDDDDDLALGMLGMHGTVYANYAVDKSDLLLAFGVLFDDRVTGKLEAFASGAKIVHIDIDSAEIGKNKQPHVSLHADMRLAIGALNSLLMETKPAAFFSNYFAEWRRELKDQRRKLPLSYSSSSSRTFGTTAAIPPQYAIQVLSELTGGNAIIATSVGQHQMWAAQLCKFNQPRHWLTSGGLGAMGFGLPAAIGAAVAKPDAVIVNIDGDGSFLMTAQEMATIVVENLPVKIMLLNNQHLGMVAQWEECFYGGNKAHTFLGNPRNESEMFPNPNMVKCGDFFCGLKNTARVTNKDDVRAAVRKMLETPGPYLLDISITDDEEDVM